MKSAASSTLTVLDKLKREFAKMSIQSPPNLHKLPTPVMAGLAESLPSPTKIEEYPAARRNLQFMFSDEDLQKVEKQHKEIERDKENRSIY